MNAIYDHGNKSNINEGKGFKPFSNLMPDLGLKYFSDEFKTNHDKTHVLFAGCSVTYASEISPELDQSWSMIVNNYLNNKIGTTGHFNISFPGSSIMLQVSSIIRYINQYAKPDIIFFNLPGSTRFFASDDKPYGTELAKAKRSEGSIITTSITESNEDKYPGSMIIAEHINFEAYLFLHEYCRNAGIKLISFTWSNKDNNYGNVHDGQLTESLFLGKFNSFYTSNKNREEFILQYYQENKNKYQHILIGSDNQHPGVAEHAYFADTAITAYESIRN
jgi:hypothetical protein